MARCVVCKRDFKEYAKKNNIKLPARAYDCAKLGLVHLSGIKSSVERIKAFLENRKLNIPERPRRLGEA